MAKTQRKVIDKVFILLGVCAVAVLLAVGSLAWWASSFTRDQVRDELVSQKIYFPPKGSPALNPTEYPNLQKYAGQPVDNGQTAKAYADDYIGNHLDKIAGGQTYAQVSSAALANPGDNILQAQKTSLFQGETLRGLLLNAYAFDTIGIIAGYAALATFIGAGLFAILVLLGLNHFRK